MNRKFFDDAFFYAELAFKDDEVPIGAVIVKNDEEIKHIKREINWQEGQVNFVKLQSTCDVHSSYIRQQCKDGYTEVLNSTNEYVKDYVIRNKLYF